MPHIVVKWFKGRTKEQTQEFVDEMVKKAVELTGRGADHFSVAVEEYDPQEWEEKVYNPEIVEKLDTVYKKPGYGSLAE